MSKLVCFECSSIVTNDVPCTVILFALLICPDCLEKKFNSDNPRLLEGVIRVMRDKKKELKSACATNLEGSIGGDFLKKVDGVWVEK